MIATNVYEDIDIAKQVIEGKSDSTIFQPFSDRSAIYRFSNENIIKYMNLLKNREKLLAITASADQILSSILLGTKKVDTIDISRFAKYYCNLKLAAIKELSREEYIRFLAPEIEFNLDRCPFRNGISKIINKTDLRDLYYGISTSLSRDSKIFWDNLFGIYDPYAVYRSKMFRNETADELLLLINGKFNNTIYLKNDKAYYELRKKLKGCNISQYTGDVFDAIEEFDQEYDLAYLSNIIDYTSVKKYFDFLNKVSLAEKGIILSDIFTNADRIKGISKRARIRRINTETLMLYK